MHNNAENIFRFDNGTLGGMLAEVSEGLVDTSIAGFMQNLPRFEVVDFTQELFGTDAVFFVRRPSKRDLSMRYFWLGMKKLSMKILVNFRS